MIRHLTTCAALALTACATVEPPPPVAAGDLPTGASRSAAGYATILAVPPSAWPDEPPPEPEFVADDLARLTSDPDPAVRAKAWEDANGPADFQAEMQRLAQLLPVAEKGNYVSMRMVRDPAVALEVWFERDAAATLAKYTSDPRFRAREGSIGIDEGMEINRLWWKRFDDARVPYGGGVNNLEGTIEFDILVTEAEYREMIRGKSWAGDTDPRLRLTFADGQPPAYADPALEPLVRAFARAEAATSIVLTSATVGKIVLEDGCFRLGGPEGSLVMFERAAQLDRDAEGYLVIRSGKDVARVGEKAVWGGYPAPRESEAGVKALRRACGKGPLVNVGAPESLRLFNLPYPEWVADYARAKKLTYRQAWDRVIGCMKRKEGAEPTFLGARDQCIRQFNDR